MLPDIAKIRKEVEETLEGRTCFTKDNKLSPFLNPPYNGLVPGVMDDVLFRFPDLYPEVFESGFHFMGSSHPTLSQNVWVRKQKLVYVQEGHFDKEGYFHAPIAVYRSEDSPESDARGVFYILFQQGSYQALPAELVPGVESGSVLVHRGIGNKTQFVPPQMEEEKREDYMHHLVYSFSSPILSLLFNDVSRAESDHIRSISDIYFDDNFSHLKGLLQKLVRGQPERSDLGQSFTLDEEVSGSKFGPNYVSFRTPLDNLRIMTQWTGEYEAQILEPSRAERVR